MKLILCLLLLEFIYVQSDYGNAGELKKYGSKSISDYQTVYLDLNDFKDESNMYFKITVYNGYFYQSYMSYGWNYISTSTISLDHTQSYYSNTYGSEYYYDGYYYYDYFTYKYVIDKPKISDRYIYIAPSRIHCHPYKNCYIEIENVSGFGLSVAVIVIIVIAVVAIVAASIIVYFCRRARRASYIAPPVAQYQPPVATAYPPPTYY